jgi:raffinose/stachyose/melibiose transport system permease protein
MFRSKKTKALTFAVFLAPALLCYSLFFVYPLIQGVRYSFTDWNGIVPEVPISFDKAEFEERILPRLAKTDQAALIRVYALDAEGVYKRENLDPKTMAGLKSIFNSIGITPIKFIGLDNYREMFNSTLDPRFLPSFATKKVFDKKEALPAQISAPHSKGLLKSRLGSEERMLLDSVYSVDGGGRRLQEEYREVTLFNLLYGYSSLDFDEIEAELEQLKQMAAEHRSEQQAFARIDGIKTLAAQNAEDREAVRSILSRYYKVFCTKELLDQYLVENDYRFGVIGFTLFFTLFNVILANLLALVLALILDQKLRMSSLLRSIFFLPNILSLVIVAFVWSFIFNRILPSLTGIEVWLGSSRLAPYLVVFVAVWQGCGYLMIIYLAGLQSIPRNLREASSIDGASPLKRFVHVTLPLMAPAITICLFWSMANSLKTFDIVFALVGNSSYVTDTTPIVLDIYFDAFNRNRFGYATAKAIFLCGIIVFLTGIQLYFMKKRETQL